MMVMVKEEYHVGKGRGKSWARGGRQGYGFRWSSQGMTFMRGGKGRSRAVICRNHISGQRDSKCKGPVARACVVCSDDSVEATVAGARSIGNEVSEVTPGRSQGLLDHCKG